MCNLAIYTRLIILHTSLPKRSFILLYKHMTYKRAGIAQSGLSSIRLGIDILLPLIEPLPEELRVVWTLSQNDPQNRKLCVYSRGFFDFRNQICNDGCPSFYYPSTAFYLYAGSTKLFIFNDSPINGPTAFEHYPQLG